jgi:gliding motility-associated-like protein
VNLDNNGTGNLTIFDVDGGTTDNCSIKRRWMSDSTIDCSNVGLHKIWFYAEDLNGNMDSAEISVTVNDNIDPVLTVQDATIYIDTAGNALLTQVMVVVSISDNCATDQVIISKTLFGLADVGDNNVDITLTDKSGNSVKKTVKVTVVIGDSDNDGIPDYVEKGGDFDGDGTKDYLDEDSDNDGLADKLENNNGATLVDTDSDTRPDYKDLDSDNDGINDVREAGLADADQNGLKDNASDLLFASVDTDGDGIGNQRELDSDNDNIFDLVESLQGYTDANLDGIVDGTDTDGDGIIDGADGSVIFGDGNDAVPADTDSDNTADYIDTDSDNDTIPDSIEGTVDTDTDGLPNYRDTDSDADTILDSYEAKTGNNPIDTDNDGQEDYIDTDSDNDLIPDKVEAGANPTTPVDTDSDGLENYRDLDSDGDKIPDTEEAGADPNNPVDTDSDGKQDYIDLDSDGDTIPDEVEAGADPNNPVDTDSDGKEDYRDTDSDGDGIPDEVEAGADPNNPVDTDGDGIMDFRDTDSDNDEIDDATEGTKDSDGNGIPDYRDAEVIIPEAISPNGDGDNDELYIKGLKVFDQAEIIVFNRNGQVVYQSGSGYNNKWDGTYNGSIPSLGKELPEGVYFYVFKYNGQNREPITGNFYIKR